MGLRSRDWADPRDTLDDEGCTGDACIIKWVPVAGAGADGLGVADEEGQYKDDSLHPIIIFNQKRVLNPNHGMTYPHAQHISSQ